MAVGIPRKLWVQVGLEGRNKAKVRIALEQKSETIAVELPGIYNSCFPEISRIDRPAQ